MLELLNIDHQHRKQVETFIHDVFAKQYKANIEHFMPHLIRLCYDQSCYSAAGYHAAESGRLFVEQYLSEPVERILSYKIGQDVSRYTIVEVGNLAEAGPGGGRDIIIALVAFLFGAGYQWGVVTAVPKVANGFRRLGLRYVELGEADPHKLTSQDQKSWGSYYDHNPKIRAADLRLTYRVLELMCKEFPPGCKLIMNEARELGLQWKRNSEKKVAENV